MAVNPGLLLNLVFHRRRFFKFQVSLNKEVKASKVIRDLQCSESKCDVTIDTLDAADSYVAKLFVNYNNAPADVAESELGSLTVPTVTG